MNPQAGDHQSQALPTEPVTRRHCPLLCLPSFDSHSVYELAWKWSPSSFRWWLVLFDSSPGRVLQVPTRQGCKARSSSSSLGPIRCPGDAIPCGSLPSRRWDADGRFCPSRLGRPRQPQVSGSLMIPGCWAGNLRLETSLALWDARGDWSSLRYGVGLRNTRLQTKKKKERKKKEKKY